MSNKTQTKLAIFVYKGKTYKNASQKANLFNRFFIHAADQTIRVNKNKTKFDEIDQDQSLYMGRCDEKEHSDVTEEKHLTRS